MTGILKKAIFWLLPAAAAFLVITILSGNRLYAVQSGSMEPAIRTGALVMIDTHTPFEKICKGDVVCFESVTGTPVIHRAVSVSTEGIETKGDANDTTDGLSTTRENYIGKVCMNIPLAGYILSFLSLPRVRILIITGLAVILIISIFRSRKKACGDQNKSNSNLKKENEVI